MESPTDARRSLFAALRNYAAGGISAEAFQLRTDRSLREGIHGILDEYVWMRVALQDIQGIALNGPDKGKTLEQRLADRLNRIDKRVSEVLERV